jgi:hypothetical protein
MSGLGKGSNDHKFNGFQLIATYLEQIQILRKAHHDVRSDQSQNNA